MKQASSREAERLDCSLHSRLSVGVSVGWSVPIGLECRDRGGRPEIKRSLFMVAMAARTHNPTLKAVYDRLRANGSPSSPSPR